MSARRILNKAKRTIVNNSGISQIKKNMNKAFKTKVCTPGINFDFSKRSYQAARNFVSLLLII